VVCGGEGGEGRGGGAENLEGFGQIYNVPYHVQVQDIGLQTSCSNITRSVTSIILLQ
jgi:hypothetical protein